MRTIIYSYAVPLMGLIFLAYLIKSNYMFSKPQQDLFKLALLVNLILMFITSIDYLIQVSVDPSLWLLRRVTSFINFAMGPVLPILLIRIFHRSKGDIKFYIPFFINTIVCFLSMFFNIVFFISENNKYARGPLFLLPPLTTAMYICVFLVRPVDARHLGKSNERTVVVAILLSMIFSVILEVSFKFHCLNYAFSALGIIIYYLSQNINFFSKDPLTGTFNRQMFNYAILRVTNAHSNCLVALLDLNNFKAINDNFGHDAGDKALIDFAEIVTHCTKGCATLYRTGGDEFMLISTSGNSAALASCIATCNRELAALNMSFAYGVAPFNGNDDLAQVLRTVDKLMYENKAQMKVARADFSI